jgi:hypothetical protein
MVGKIKLKYWKWSGFIWLRIGSIECSLYRLIRRPEHLIGRHCGISRQTEGHSFGDHLISESVSVTQSRVIFSCALLCVFMTRPDQ